MAWERISLGEIAPAGASRMSATGDSLWHLTLDQLESHTGEIIEKKYIEADSIPPSTNRFDDGNVLYSKLRPYLNKVHAPEEAGVATSELVPLRPDPNRLNRSFLAYFLRSQEFLGFATACVAGAKMPRMVMRRMWEYQIPVPHPKEQARIVELLDQADELRKLRTQADNKAARILPALFHHYFGDISNGHSEIIGDLTSLVTSGVTPRGGSKVYIDEGPFLIRSQNVQMNAMSLNDVAHIPDEMFKRMERVQVLPGDTLLNITGASLGRVTPVIRMDQPAVVNQHVCIIRPIPEKLSYVYLSFLLSTDFYQRAILQQQSGAAQAGFNHSKVRALKIPVPEMSKQHAFAHDFIQHQETIGMAANSKQKLEDLFQLLLHRAFTGELTAKWREDHMSEIVDEMTIQTKA
ncbi:MAG: restriction endonuclease subunit S [Lentimonas sp.]